VQHRTVRQAVVLLVERRGIGRHPRFGLLYFQQPRWLGRIAGQAEVIHDGALLQPGPLVLVFLRRPRERLDAAPRKRGRFRPGAGARPVALGREKSLPHAPEHLLIGVRKVACERLIRQERLRRVVSGAPVDDDIHGDHADDAGGGRQHEPAFLPAA
jgi:hypothetical protein